MTKEFFTTKEAAEYLALKSPGSLSNMRHNGKGPKYRKAGKVIRYHIDDLNAWLKPVEITQ